MQRVSTAAAAANSTKWGWRGNTCIAWGFVSDWCDRRVQTYSEAEWHSLVSEHRPSRRTGRQGELALSKAV